MKRVYGVYNVIMAASLAHIHAPTVTTTVATNSQLSSSPCPYCQTYGINTHSFHEIARTPKFGRIIYTCISKAEDYSNKNAIVTHITNTLDTEPLIGWSWVFDCRDLKMKHTMQLDIAITLSRLISSKYADRLQMIIILNPTPGVDAIIKHVLPLFRSESLQYLRKMKGSALEIYMALQREQMEEAGIQAIMDQLRGL